MEVLAAAGIVVPPAVSLAYEALVYAYKLYKEVQGKRAQLKLLLDRCAELVLEVKKQIQLGISPAMQKHIVTLEKTCVCVKDTIASLVRRGFVWCLFHRDDIDQMVADTDKTVTNAFQMFDFVAHVNHSRFQSQMADARKADQTELLDKLDELSRNDHKILEVLQDKDRQFRKLEELLLGMSKYIQASSQHISRAPEARSEESFIRTAVGALQRISKRSSSEIVPRWVLTSLEVAVDHDDENLIGRGSFGRIYKADWDGKIVAVKEMYQEDARSLNVSELNELHAEIQIWSRLAHPHVLPFYGACLEAAQPFMVSSYCKLGNAVQYVAAYPDADRVRLIDDIASGIRYLHRENIVHADLKGVNVLVGDDHRALLSDFGISRLLDDIATTRSRKTSQSAPSNGTLRWMSPECLEGDPATKASDVYSFAITSWELFSGEVPFAGKNERVLALSVIDRQLRPKRPSTLTSDQLWGLIERCWSPDPSTRPSFAAIQAALKPLLQDTTGRNIIGGKALDGRTMLVGNASAADGQIQSGLTYRVTNFQTGKVLDLGRRSRRVILVSPWHGQSNQKWVMERHGNSWALKSVYTGSYVGLGKQGGNALFLSATPVPVQWDIRPVDGDPLTCGIYMPGTNRNFELYVHETKSYTYVTIHDTPSDVPQVWRFEECQ